MSGRAHTPKWLIAVVALEATLIVVGGGIVTLFIAGLGGSGWVIIGTLYLAAPLAALAVWAVGVYRLILRGWRIGAVVLALVPLVGIALGARSMGFA